MDVAVTSAVVSVVGALVAVGALVVSVVNGRAGRRNTEFLGHRDLWWQRWSWVADRATSDDEDRRAAAAVMSAALVTRSWTTDDDTWTSTALADFEAARAEARTQQEGLVTDDLETD
ncbi:MULTISPECIES: hypothetical protein [unclassified Curtobacterium]|jgi:hypothetical protein|uniref:hypothetical protein n=1 Tax=unclassified Curtobacterium TaxID=257496 RepID=UPI0019688004|nr:hypothetical protein [Curtobacterium sp. RIT-PI-V]QSB23947.1 hypothetical protein JN350_04475 [Curtobacterium sp. 24E2]